MSSDAYAAELSLALRTVHRASLLTKSVLRSLKNHVEASTKADDSPVTIADFAAQALIISAIHAVYPDDTFLGEESAEALRNDAALADSVWGLVQRGAELGLSDASAKSEVQGAAPAQPRDLKALAAPGSKEEMLDVIDLGTTAETRKGRVWVMDPVDGTATFMEGKQYAVCLCLLVDGAQQVGVIGCPNLKFDVQGPLNGQQKMHEDLVDEAGHGVVLSAVKGQGTYVRTMSEDGFGPARQVRHDGVTKDMSTLDFVETTLGKTSLSQSEHHDIAKEVGAKWPGTVMWSQQLKYVALTLGCADVMLRVPKDKARYTHVWDHAGGQILFQETGGIIHDVHGNDIDLGQGRRISGSTNEGMIAARPPLFDGIMRAVTAVLERRTG